MAGFVAQPGVAYPGQFQPGLAGTPPVPPISGFRTELFTSAWRDISQFVYQRDTVGLQRGRLNEAATMSTATATFTLNNRDGRFTTRNPSGAYWPFLVQNSPVRFSQPASAAGLPNYLRLEGDTTSGATAADKAALQITGPIDVRVDLWPSDYQQNVLAAKWGNVAKSWIFTLDRTPQTGSSVRASTACPGFVWFDGSNPQALACNVPVPYFGQRICLRVVFTPSAGTATFYTAATMAGPFTQLGATQTFILGATTLPAGAGQAVQVGGTAAVNSSRGYTSALGMIYEAQIYSNVTLVADPVFSGQPAGAPSLADAQGNTWTLNGTAEISDRQYRFHGEMGSFPKAADPSAQDVYSQAQAYGLSKRLRNSSTPAYSPLRRAYLRQPAQTAAYWPAEDGSTATSAGSATGGPPLVIAGNGVPTFASNSNFACSSGIPVMNGGTFYGQVTTPAGFTWTDNVVNFLIEVPSGDDTNGAVMCQVATTGTCSVIQVVYGTGGFITLNVFGSGGALIGTSTSGSIQLGVPMFLTLTVSASGQNVTAITNAIGSSFSTGPLVSFSGSVGAVTGVQFGGGLTGSAMGQFAVQNTQSTVVVLGVGAAVSPLTAWTGEAAAARFSRICGEEGIACRIIGSASASMPMGNQPIDTIYGILQQCENTDLGMMFEPRQCVGLGYRTRQSLYHQAPLATASYSAGQVYQGFASTGDTQLAVNDVTAQAPSGSLARQQLTAGNMSLQSPPAGIGRVDTQINPAPKLDPALNQIASWYLNVRAVDDDRYPSIPFQMARSLTPQSIALLDIGDYLQITNTPSWLPPGPVRQLCAGLAETLFPGTLWELNVNGIPEAPYETAQLGPMHLDTAGSQLTSPVTAGATSFQVSTTAGPVWTQAGGDFPFDILADGERMTVTNITGASSPQTFTVTRAVNGVTKSHNAAVAVALYNKPILAL